MRFRRRRLLRAAGGGTLLGGLVSAGSATASRTQTQTQTQTRTPTEVAGWSPLQYDADVEGWNDLRVLPATIHDVTVQNGVAYCAYWDAGTWMVDVSDPSAPSYSGHVGDYSLSRVTELGEQIAAGDGAEFQRLFREAPGNDHYAAATEDGSVLAVGGEAWNNPATEEGGPAGVRLYDVSDPTDPSETARIDHEAATNTTRDGTWVTSHNFELRNDRLYTSWYDAGVKIHDISDPSNPELLAWWLQPGQARFWTAQVLTPGETFVASATGFGGSVQDPALYVFPDRAGTQPERPSLTGDGTGPADPDEPFEPLARLELPGAAEVVVEGETGYVATGNGAAVVDLSDPTDPTVLTEITDIAADREGGPLSNILDVAVDDDRLLVSGPAQRGLFSGFIVYDVSDPADPTPVTEFTPTSHSIHNADIDGDHVYLTNNATPDRPLSIYDITGTQSTTTTETTTTTNAATTTTTTQTATTTETENEETPGFGVAAALAGLGYGAYRYVTGGDGEE